MTTREKIKDILFQVSFYSLMAVITWVVIAVSYMTDPEPEPTQWEIAYENKIDSLLDIGWKLEPAIIIAGFEMDLYDENDTVEYALYQSYLED